MRRDSTLEQCQTASVLTVRLGRQGIGPEAEVPQTRSIGLLLDAQVPSPSMMGSLGLALEAGPLA